MHLYYCVNNNSEKQPPGTIYYKILIIIIMSLFVQINIIFKNDVFRLFSLVGIMLFERFGMESFLAFV